MYAPNKLQILVVVEKKIGSDPLFTESDDGFFHDLSIKHCDLHNSGMTLDLQALV